MAGRGRSARRGAGSRAKPTGQQSIRKGFLSACGRGSLCTVLVRHLLAVYWVPGGWLLPILRDFQFSADDRVGDMRKHSSSTPGCWRVGMHSSFALTSLDTVLLMAPFGVFLVAAMFGLDERFAGGSISNRHRPRFCEVGLDGRGELSDPDGRSPERERWTRRSASGGGNRFVTRYDRSRGKRTGSRA